jgi:hypothetical protein
VSSTVTRRRLDQPVDDLSVLFLPNICSPWWCVFVPPVAAAARVGLRLGISSSGSPWWCRRFPGRGKGGRLRPSHATPKAPLTWPGVRRHR